jgi:dTDP-4-amino-4,6-dideoxygalactose transaminase
MSSLGLRNCETVAAAAAGRLSSGPRRLSDEQPHARGRADETYPVTERLAKRGLYLPSGLTLTEAQIDEVCGVVRDVLTAA